MDWKLGKSSVVMLIGAFVLASASVATPASAFALGTGQAAAPVAASVGTIKAIQGNSITLAPDSGSPITVTVQDSTRMLRVEPGQKTLQGATPVQLQDLQVGDRIVARGARSADGASLTASSILLMKKSDIQQNQQQQEQDWQRNGVGGLVKSVDASSDAIVISTGGGPTAKVVTVNTTKDTVLRRYAADSVKFSDSTPGTFDQIKPGDQLRALGTKSPDGSAVAAKEVVSGSFRNIAGTVISVDASANEVSVNDLLTKHPAEVKLTPDSTIKKLPAMMAQMIAMRLKGTGGGPPSAGGNDNHEAQAQPSTRFQGQGPGAAPDANGHRWGGPGGEAVGRPDFQQFLNRLPPASLTDLQKGDAVMIVSTAGGEGGAVTAITLLSGVEPILTAAPSSSQAASFMSNWTLGGGGGGEGGDAGP